MHVVVELPTFLRAAKGLISDHERAELVDFFAANPEAGIAIAGYVRKARYARAGGGKRGGFRVYFVYAGEDLPLFLLTMFGKNEKADLSKAERQTIGDLAKAIVDDYRSRCDG